MTEPHARRQRGRPRARTVAAQAADAFRHGGYESVSHVAIAFVRTHYGHGRFRGMSDKEIRRTEPFRQFREYVFEELENGPQSLRIRFKILGIRRRNRAKQTRDVKPEEELAHQLERTALRGSLRLSDQIPEMQHQLLSTSWIKSELSKLRQLRFGAALVERTQD